MFSPSVSESLDFIFIWFLFRLLPTVSSYCQLTGYFSFLSQSFLNQKCYVLKQIAEPNSWGFVFSSKCYDDSPGHTNFIEQRMLWINSIIPDFSKWLAVILGLVIDIKSLMYTKVLCDCPLSILKSSVTPIFVRSLLLWSLAYHQYISWWRPGLGHLNGRLVHLLWACRPICSL